MYLFIYMMAMMTLLRKCPSQHLKHIINKQIATKLSSSEFLKNHVTGTVLKTRFSFYGAHEQQDTSELY